MDRTKAMRVVASDATVSDKIRALDAAGYPRAEIARLLGKRYQHVRNVLEADKLQASRRAQDNGSTAGGGVEDAGRTFERTYRLDVNREGWVYLPPEVRAVVGGGNGVLIADLLEDRLVILSGRAAARRVQERLQPYMGGASLVDELIAERRAENARDDAETAEWLASQRKDG